MPSFTTSSQKPSETVIQKRARAIVFAMAPTPTWDLLNLAQKKLRELYMSTTRYFPSVAEDCEYLPKEMEKIIDNEYEDLQKLITKIQNCLVKGQVPISLSPLE